MKLKWVLLAASTLGGFFVNAEDADACWRTRRRCGTVTCRVPSCYQAPQCAGSCAPSCAAPSAPSQSPSEEVLSRLNSLQTDLALIREVLRTPTNEGGIASDSDVKNAYQQLIDAIQKLPKPPANP